MSSFQFDYKSNPKESKSLVIFSSNTGNILVNGADFISPASFFSTKVLGIIASFSGHISSISCGPL